MAGTIVADIIQSDQSYASSINIASPMVVSNTLTMGAAAAISGNVNFDSGTLFVDSVNNRVGLGVTPAYKLDIENPTSSDSTPVARVGTSRNLFLQPGLGTNGIYGSGIGFHGYFDTVNGNFVLASGRNTYGGAGITSDYDGNLDFYNYYNGSTSGAPTQAYSTAKKMRIDYNGRVTTPYQPAFLARKESVTNTTYSEVTGYDSTEFNVGSCFSTSTGRFTAPVDGVYLFAVTMGVNGSNAYSCDINLNGTRKMRVESNGVQAYWINATVIIKMVTNEYVSIYKSGSGTNSMSGSGQGGFCGMLIG